MQQLAGAGCWQATSLTEVASEKITGHTIQRCVWFHNEPSPCVTSISLCQYAAPFDGRGHPSSRLLVDTITQPGVRGLSNTMRGEWDLTYFRFQISRLMLPPGYQFVRLVG